MKLLTLSFLFALTLCSASVTACSCYVYDTFCAMAGDYLHETWSPSQIVTARPLRIYNFNPFDMELGQPLFDVVVTRSLRGELAVAGDTITFRLHNGVNCAVWENQVDTLSEQLFFFRGLGAGGEDFDLDGMIDTLFSPHGTTTLGNCGPTFLPLVNGMVYGPIAPGIDSMLLTDLVTDESLCIAAPQEPMIECDRRSISVCNQLVEIADGEDSVSLNLVRLEHLGARYTSSSRGRRALVADFRIVQQETGSLTRSGDTISVVLRGDNRCVPFNDYFDYRPRPGYTYLHYFTSLDRTGGFGLEGYESLMSRFPVTEAARNVKSFMSIRNDSVITGFSPLTLVPYSGFMAELKACAELVSTRPGLDAVDLSVFPNPARERITVAWEGAATQIELLDITGRIRLQTKNINLRDRHEFDVDHLPPGVYFIRLTSVQGMTTRKVVVN